MDVCTCTCDPSISAHPTVTTTVNLADGKLAKADEKAPSRRLQALKCCRIPGL